jgi:hypothetical protein
MYIDESGDTGLVNSPTAYFALSGIVVHEYQWRTFLDHLIHLKKQLRKVHGLPVRAEIHAAPFISGQVHGLQKHVRLAILRDVLDDLATLPYISITNVVVDKSSKQQGYDVFGYAWRYLFQRFENTLRYGNFPGGHQQDSGLVISDATAGKKLSRLIRQMAVYNYVPNQALFGPGARNLRVSRIIEDPFGKESHTTLPIQMADVCAYFLHQKYRPNSYIRRKRAHNYFDRLKPILNLRASGKNALGIVEI